MSSNIIVFPQRTSAAITTQTSTVTLAHVGTHALHAANSPVGPGIELPRNVRMRSVGGNRPVAGRMVLTGRLADVCAELSRMAALEACA